MCRTPPEGKGACSISCAGVCKNGDLFSFRALGFGGGYEVGPGRGKCANASGRGTFETVQTDDPAIAYLRWKGTRELK